VTLLHFAIIMNKEDVVLYLIRSGYDVLAVDVDGLCPLHYAATFCRPSVAQILLDNGADINQVDNFGATALHKAIAVGNKRMVVFLIGIEGIKDVKDRREINSLHIACIKGYSSILKSLLKCQTFDFKSQINDQEHKHQYTPLHFAAERGHLKCVTVLMRRKPNIDILDSKGETPLHKASFHGHTEIVEILLSNNAIIVQNNKGNSPVHFSCIGGYMEIVQKLAEKGAELSPLNELCQTPLHIAAKRGKTYIVKYLLENDTVVNIKDVNGLQPLDYASLNRYDSIASILINYGADVSLMYKHPRDNVGLMKRIVKEQKRKSMMIIKNLNYDEQIDPFGFLLEDRISRNNHNDLETLRKNTESVKNRKKWDAFLEDWDKFVERKRQHRKLRKRITTYGIPNNLRGQYWTLSLQVEMMKENSTKKI